MNSQATSLSVLRVSSDASMVTESRTRPSWKLKVMSPVGTSILSFFISSFLHLCNLQCMEAYTYTLAPTNNSSSFFTRTRGYIYVCVYLLHETTPHEEARILTRTDVTVPNCFFHYCYYFPRSPFCTRLTGALPPVAMSKCLQTTDDNTKSVLM